MVSHLVTVAHGENGAGVVSINPPRMIAGEVGIDVNGDAKMAVVQGRMLNPKDVRGLLFHIDDEVKENEDVVLWFAYDEEDDKSYIGTGVMVDATENQPTA